jgi:photosystem II stability/assembly factor-like uncharacterized protein
MKLLKPFVSLVGSLAMVAVSVPGCGPDVTLNFAWQPVLTNLPGAALSITGTSRNDVYIVGADSRDGMGPMALHFNGQRWDRINTTVNRGDLWWVAGVSPAAVFMVGTGGTVLRLNPTTNVIERMTTPDQNTVLFGAWGSSADDVWAVGGDTGTNRGALWHLVGGAWTSVAIPESVGPEPQTLLYKVWGRTRNDVWAVGINGLTLHWDGNVWSRVAVPTSARGPIFTVHGDGSQRFAVGGNVSALMLEADGNTWRHVDTISAPRLAGVYVPNGGTAVAVGNEGSVYHRYDGRWQQVARPPQTDLHFHAVWVEPGTGAVWAVGGSILSNPLTQGMVQRFGLRETLPSQVVVPEALTRCGGVGVICTMVGSGAQGFNGDGRPLRESEMYWPLDVEYAPDQTPYLIDWNNHRVRRITRANTLETVIGTDLPGDGPEDLGDTREPGAMGTTVSLNHPTDMLFQPDGRMLLVAWHNHKIRRFDPTNGLVFVTLGSDVGFVGDNGPVAMARLKQPSHAVFDRANNFYILDQGNGRIRRVDSTGTITTIAGNGMRGYVGDGGPAAMAVFNWQGGENPEPEGGMTLGPDGNLYIADTGNHRIRRINLAAMTIESIAGDGMFRFAGDGGPASMASLYSPLDLEFGPDGDLYFADSGNHRIRAINLTTGVIRTVAGNGMPGYSGDRGPAAQAQLWRPWGVAFDPQGALVISDTLNNRIRRVQLQ